MALNPISILPGKKKPQRRCERCGLYHDKELEQCPHCSELSDLELADFQRQWAERAQANKNLGITFIVIAVALAALLVLFL